MFFIMGISDAVKKLDFNQCEICKCCGKYGQIEVYMTYMYLMLFFIPVFKWNKKYYAKMTCCGATCEIDKEFGDKIRKGGVSRISYERLEFHTNSNPVKQCMKCGFATVEDFRYCPKCGGSL